MSKIHLIVLKVFALACAFMGFYLVGFQNDYLVGTHFWVMAVFFQTLYLEGKRK